MGTKPLFDFSIRYLSVEGIHDPHHGCKLPYFTIIIINDIEILSETWGKCKHNLHIEGYKLIELQLQKNIQQEKGKGIRWSKHLQREGNQVV